MKLYDAYVNNNKTYIKLGHCYGQYPFEILKQFAKNNEVKLYTERITDVRCVCDSQYKSCIHFFCTINNNVYAITDLTENQFNILIKQSEGG
jgi:hypothetical protein